MQKRKMKKEKQKRYPPHEIDNGAHTGANMSARSKRVFWMQAHMCCSGVFMFACSPSCIYARIVCLLCTSTWMRMYNACFYNTGAHLTPLNQTSFWMWLHVVWRMCVCVCVCFCVCVFLFSESLLANKRGEDSRERDWARQWGSPSRTHTHTHEGTQSRPKKFISIVITTPWRQLL